MNRSDTMGNSLSVSHKAVIDQVTHFIYQYLTRADMADWVSTDVAR